ncbi:MULTISPECIES: hypothetical protein [Legionella]|uniref:Uncharacterized protein n=1 Tax=Legionella maceachernii TaxID=466 RepID=A0A0W0W4H7_9GAMM|nr:hypothetical protein [Legionella maceachernii]KTD27091.1 hypothetical protein Lmac_1339 [Legionella maceachernii]SKA04763.1 hypothetical protein SAMN02745128_01897 [Legionella maceachernii]SUP00304.1 Uncharacterised protein [Legionella maceachernii]
MKNSIIENYLHLLKTSKFISSKQKQLAADLSNKLPYISTVRELHALFSQYSKLSHSNFIFNLFCCFFSPFEESTPFIQLKERNLRDLSALLEDWNDFLMKQETLKRKIHNRLVDLPHQNESEPLVRLIRKLFEHPHCSMNRQAYSLLVHLNSAHLESALATLAKLPPATPKNLRKGDFGAPVTTDHTALDADHTACLGLLANNSAAYVSDTPDWMLANSLLQVALQMYDDFHNKDLEIEHVPSMKEETEHHYPSSSICAI